MSQQSIMKVYANMGNRKKCVTIPEYKNIKEVESGLTGYQSREPTEEKMRWRILELLYRRF